MRYLDESINSGFQILTDALIKDSAENEHSNSLVFVGLSKMFDEKELDIHSPEFLRQT